MKCFRVLKNAKRPVITDFLKGEPDNIISDWVNEGGNYGVLTGEVNNLVVIDCDNHKENQKTGWENLKEYMARHGVGLPDTFVVTTASGGKHIYFSIPEKYIGKRFHQQIKSIPFVDFQHNGRYVVGTNSVVDGNAYTVTHDWNIAEAPEWIMDLYEREAAPANQKNRRPNKSAQVMNFMVAGCHEGGRNIWLTQLVGKLLATGAELKTVAHMTKIANDNFVQPPLSKDEVSTIFKSVVRKDKRG